MQQLPQLADIHSYFKAFETASVDFENVLLKDRPFEATAIFWSNSLGGHPIKDVDETST